LRTGHGVPGPPMRAALFAISGPPDRDQSPQRIANSLLPRRNKLGNRLELVDPAPVEQPRDV
jgi:hypothetical protein